MIGDRRAVRVAVAFTLFSGAEYAVWVALMVFAYGRGGATESGLVAVSQLLPAAAIAPFAGVLAEHHPPERVLMYGYWLQSGPLAVAALILAVSGPALAVYGMTMLMTVAIVATRPAQALVTPYLARSADELTALNVVTEWSGQVAVFGAPAAAAGLLAVGGAELVFACFAGTLIVSALSIPRLDSRAGSPGRIGATARAEVRDGFRIAVRDPAVRTVLLVNALLFVSIGALDVVTVVLAIDRLGGTASTAAWMTATLGAGGIVGAALGGWVLGRRLAPTLVVAAMEYGIALAVIGLFPNEVLAFAMLFTAGIGQILVSIASQSILQRCSPSASVGRIFALREALFCLGLAAGSILASTLIASVGLGATLIVLGALLPGCSLLNVRTMWQLDSAATVPIVELSLLRTLPIFQHLPTPTLEGLAKSAASVRFEPGTYLMREGEPGHDFFAIGRGVAQVERHGLTVGTVSTGDGVGEVALLRDVARTASVRARTAVDAVALGKDEFLIAVTGHPATAAIANHIVTGHARPPT